jgi:ABC-type bacteriocin/lantibiotic exporter with double-glycine peptidase domain
MFNLKFFAFGLLISTLFLAATGCTTSNKVSNSNTFSAKAVLLDVPFKMQKDPNLCGLAVLEMLALYYDKPLGKEQVKRLKKEADQKKAVTGATLEEVLRSAGYYTAIFPGTFDDSGNSLYRHLDKKRPLIVMLASDDGQFNHYELVTGYDWKWSLISVSDPARGPLAMPLANFSAAWKRAKSFTLLAVPESKKDAKISGEGKKEK